MQIVFTVTIFFQLFPFKLFVSKIEPSQYKFEQLSDSFIFVYYIYF